MPKCPKVKFLNSLREKLVAAAEKTKGVNIWTADPLDEPSVTGFVLEYGGECYVVEIFAEEQEAEHDQSKNKAEA